MTRWKCADCGRTFDDSDSATGHELDRGHTTHPIR